MKTLLSLAVAVATVTGSLAQLTLPTCGATCMVEAVSITSCSASDLQCLCTNPAYISKAVNCIADTCDSSDAQNSYAYATYACNSVGVQVPSVASVLSSAPAPAPAPAAVTPAPAPAPVPAPAPAPAPAGPPSSSTSSMTSATSTAVVTFQGSASRAEKGVVAAIVFGVVAILGARMI